MENSNAYCGIERGGDEGQKIYDAYSEISAVVSNGKVSIDSPYDVVLLQAEKTE